MNHKFATLAFVGLTSIVLSACGAMPAKSAEAPMEPAKPMLSEAAQQALAKAEADYKDAKAKFAVWTTTDKALKAAEAAAKEGKSDEVIKQAKFASDLAALGIAQLSYPTTEK